jgi:hypothetical protein
MSLALAAKGKLGWHSNLIGNFLEALMIFDGGH